MTPAEFRAFVADAAPVIEQQQRAVLAMLGDFDPVSEQQAMLAMLGDFDPVSAQQRLQEGWRLRSLARHAKRCRAWATFTNGQAIRPARNAHQLRACRTEPRCGSYEGHYQPPPLKLDPTTSPIASNAPPVSMRRTSTRSPEGERLAPRWSFQGSRR